MKPAKYEANLAETKDWLLCKDHLEIYEWGVTGLKLVNA